MRPSNRRLPLAPALVAVLAATTAVTLTLAAAPQAAGAPAAGAELQQAQPLPPAGEILEASLKASGGREALAGLESVYFEGTYSMAAMGLEGTVRGWQVPPDKLLVVAEFPGLGRIEQGYDGEVGWARDPMQGPRLLADAELAQLKATEGLLQDPDHASTFSVMETLDRVTYEGRPAFKVRLVQRETGAESIAFYDVENGRHLGLQTTAVSPMGKVPVEIVMTEYRTFGPLTVPTRIVNRMPSVGMDMIVMTIGQVAFDVEDLPSFGPPPEIRALMPAGESAAPPGEPAARPDETPGPSGAGGS